MHYSIGQIEKLTGIKAHVLRYWEEVVPSLRPQKNTGGRRTYSQKELNIILRLKHLIYDRQFTIEGAQKQLMAELDQVEKNADILMEIEHLREELSQIYLELKK